MSQIGPELTKKRVAALLVTAIVIITLFAVRMRRPAITEPDLGVFPDIGIPELTISPFDSLFKANSDSVFDWKFLAAIAFVESRFDTSLVSGAGASGLMQVMPATYRHNLDCLGISNTDTVSTELNVMAAVRQLHEAAGLFNFIDKNERVNFILGAYNCGSGHVFDAMRIARKNGVNRYVWNNIEDVMETMGDSAVYSDTAACHCGPFINSWETIRFVRKVRKKYQEYCNLDMLPSLNE